MVKISIAVVAVALILIAISMALPSRKSSGFDDCMHKADDYARKISNAALRQYVQTIAKERMAETGR